MAIDNPIDAARKQIEAEERESSPVTESILELAGQVLPWVGVIGMFRDRERNERQRVFLETLKAELSALTSRFDKLEEKHRVYLKTDFAALVLDGLQKAENTRAEDRIVRLAKIVASSAYVYSEVSLDDTEELMRVATSVTDVEVEFLRQMTLMPNSKHPNGIATIEDANDDWKDHYPKISGVNLSEYQSIGLKLQSFGLIESVERRPMKLGPDVSPYRLLKKGARLIALLQMRA